jgi:hypothetical protein
VASGQSPGRWRVSAKASLTAGLSRYLETWATTPLRSWPGTKVKTGAPPEDACENGPSVLRQRWPRGPGRHRSARDIALYRLAEGLRDVTPAVLAVALLRRVSWRTAGAEEASKSPVDVEESADCIGRGLIPRGARDSRATGISTPRSTLRPMPLHPTGRYISRRKGGAGGSLPPSASRRLLPTVGNQDRGDDRDRQERLRRRALRPRFGE